jgi:hypothetical protein
MTTTPAPIRIKARTAVGERRVVVAVHEDGTELTVNANAPAEQLIDLLDEVDQVGDLIASHHYVKAALGDDQYATLRTWGLTQAEYAAIGAHIIDVCSGAVFGMGDHLDLVDELLIRTPDLVASIEQTGDAAILESAGLDGPDRIRPSYDGPS